MHFSIFAITVSISSLFLALQFPTDCAFLLCCPLVVTSGLRVAEWRPSWSQWTSGLKHEVLSLARAGGYVFESHLRHECVFVFVLFLCYPVFLVPSWVLQKLKSGQGTTKSSRPIVGWMINESMKWRPRDSRTVKVGNPNLIHLTPQSDNRTCFQFPFQS